MGSNFRKNRMVGFIDCGDTYWEALEDGQFKLCRCAACEQWLWDPMVGGMDIRCGFCGSWDQTWVDVEPEGVVSAWAITNQAFEGAESFKDEVPYVTVETQLLGPGGPCVIGLLRGPRDGLRVGSKVRGEIEPPSEQTKGYAAVRWRLA